MAILRWTLATVLLLVAILILGLGGGPRVGIFWMMVCGAMIGAATMLVVRPKSATASQAKS